MRKTILHSPFSILHLTLVHCSLFICMFSFVMMSCSKTTSPKTGSLTGNITLVNDTNNPANEPADFAGVTIAIYNPAKLDTTFVRVNANYPEIGVQISQETEFDHRLQNPVKVVTTSPEGSFSMTKIPVGTYNLVVLKEGWGVRYFYNLHIVKGKQTLNSFVQPALKAVTSKRSAVELYPAVVPGSFENGYDFKSEHSYIINDDVSIVGAVHINPSSYIWIAPTKSITVNEGSITTPATNVDYARVTTSYGMYNKALTAIEPTQYFYSIDCSALVSFTQNKLSSVITSFAQNGWNIKSSNLAISNMVFNHNRIGLQFNQANDLTITNCNVMSSSDSELGGITLTSCDDTEIVGLFVKGCTIGLRQHTCANAIVRNCFFYQNSIRDIYNVYETVGTIEHCDFGESKISIETSGMSNTTILRCKIQGKVGILNTSQLNWYTSIVKANFNNFNCTEYAVKTRAAFDTVDEVHLDAKNNYWSTTNVSQITGLIWDRLDEDTNDPNYHRYTGVIDYVPFKAVYVQDAGLIGAL